MDRRHALSIAVAATLSITGIGAAIGATTNIFSAADASELGKISPVSSTTLPPVVEHVRVDVDDPAPVPPPAAPATAPARVRASSDAEHQAAAATRASAPAPAPAPAPVSHEREGGHEMELDD